MAGKGKIENLKSFASKKSTKNNGNSRLTVEESRKIQQMGGIASAEARKKKKNAIELLELMSASQMPENEAEEIRTRFNTLHGEEVIPRSVVISLNTFREATEQHNDRAREQYYKILFKQQELDLKREELKIKRELAQQMEKQKDNGLIEDFIDILSGKNTLKDVEDGESQATDTESD